MIAINVLRAVVLTETLIASKHDIDILDPLRKHVIQS
jgi:hypothetical protein